MREEEFARMAPPVQAIARAMQAMVAAPGDAEADFAYRMARMIDGLAVIVAEQTTANETQR
jgi:hypothetical protein